MDFIINSQHQQMQQQFFQNQRYSFGDFDTKKITLFYSGSGTINTNQNDETLPSNTITTLNSSGVPSSSYVTATYETVTGNFAFNLIEPITIDKMSDVFLDNFSIYNCNASMSTSTKGESYGIVLNFNDINQNNFSNNSTIHDGELIILDTNEGGSDSGTFIVAKNKKFNYMGVMQPGRYKTINGRLTDINSGVLKRQQDDKNLVFSIELLISNKK
jgi:hypothetical protein